MVHCRRPQSETLPFAKLFGRGTTGQVTTASAFSHTPLQTQQESSHDLQETARNELSGSEKERHGHGYHPKDGPNHHEKTPSTTAPSTPSAPPSRHHGPELPLTAGTGEGDADGSREPRLGGGDAQSTFP